jgi:hypothetical protein
MTSITTMLSNRTHRVFCAVAALTVLVATGLGMRREAPPSHAFRVVFGLRDSETTDWSGRISVSGGEAASLEGWRFEGNDAVDGNAGWHCRTRKSIALESHYALPPSSGKADTPPQRIWPAGVTCSVRGTDPEVTVVLQKGEVKFRSSEVSLGEPRTFLAGQVRVERLPMVSIPRAPAPPSTINPTQDDYPALWVDGRTNKQYLAWVAYRKEADCVLSSQRDGPEDSWGIPVEVAGPGDHFRVALAGTKEGVLWIVWSDQRRNAWQLYARPLKQGRIGAELLLSDTPGPHIWHRMTTDLRGRVWLAWQGFRDGRSQIFARCADGAGWHDTVQVSAGDTNHWDPAMAADPKEDRVWFGWDEYDRGKINYQVRVRSLAGGVAAQLGEVLAPESSPCFSAHVSLACDRAGRLWAAWDSSGPQWGKDTGFLYRNSSATRLYASREIHLKCLDKGDWLEPAAQLESVLSAELKEYNELPQLQPDYDGRIWLAFRHRTCLYPRQDGWAFQGRWDLYATAYLGDRWLAPIELPDSAGRNDMRTSSHCDRDGNVYFAYTSDNRYWTGLQTARNQSNAVCRLGQAPPFTEPALVEGRHDLPQTAAIHPKEEEDVARVRKYRIQTGGKTYRIYRGDLHRHTDISVDGIGDGSLMDLHRYALDAAALDYVLVGDHNMGDDREYPWWRTQQANDLYTVPGKFISMYGYERSVPYPNGHRNVIWTKRGHRTLPLPQAAIPAQMAADTSRLYAYLRRTNGICTLHTSATEQGTNWQEHDNSLEPVVEIYQGYHTSYEAPGAIRTVTEDTPGIHGPIHRDGLVSHALELGHRLGFQASSDHISTHVSYACVLAEEFSRDGLVSAMRKRHSYAATDNIILDVRAGSFGIMGDEVRTNQPHLDIHVVGTGPIANVDVLRDGEVRHSERPGGDATELVFRWEDPAPAIERPTSYYYVRMIQKNGQMAWSSPIWVRGSR